MLKSWAVVLTFNSDVKRLLGTFAFLSFGYFGILGVLFNLYLLRLGFEIEFIGLLLAVGQLLWGISSLPASAIGQRIGLRNAVILGTALAGASMALLLLVELLPQPLWVPWIVVTWAISWIGAALQIVNSTPFMMSAARATERNHAFAAQSATFAFMGLVGAVIAGILPGVVANLMGETLDSPAPFRITLWLVPICYTLAALVLAGASPIRLANQRLDQSQAGAPVGLFVLLGLIVFLLATGGGAARAFFNVFLDIELQVQAAHIGAIMGFAQVLPVLISLVTPTILARWGSERTLMFAGLTTAAALIVLGLSEQWLLAAFSFTVVISVVAIQGTSQTIFSQELVAEHWRSISSAVITIGLALGWAAAAALGGTLVDAVGFRVYFFACAALNLLAAIVLIGRLLILRPRTPQVVPSSD
jgi:MFS family permease